MKGKATFILKEAATGRVVREFTEHNLVTDAVSRILNPPRNAMMGDFLWDSFINAALPLYKNIIGGIMLLGNTLPERKDNVMLSKDCIPVAAAGDAYSGSLATRGSLNLNESYETANGYHFTWDFGTDKANGTIKSVALTNRSFGNSGFGYQGKNNGHLLSSIYLVPGMKLAEIASANGEYIATIEKCTHVFLRSTKGNSLTFDIVKSVDPDNVRINDVPPLNAVIAPERSVDVTLPFEPYSYELPFVDTINKRILFTTTSSKIADGRYQFDYAWVNYTDFSVTTGSLVFGNDHNSYLSIAIYDGKVYVAQGSKLYEYSSGENSPREWAIHGIVTTPFYLTNDILTIGIYSGYLAMYMNGDFIITDNSLNYSILDSVDILAPYYACTEIYQYSKNYNCHPFLVLAGNYLATINNLSEPIEKTNEHTLKITYDITN